MNFEANKYYVCEVTIDGVFLKGKAYKVTRVDKDSEHEGGDIVRINLEGGRNSAFRAKSDLLRFFPNLLTPDSKKTVGDLIKMLSSLDSKLPVYAVESETVLPASSCWKVEQGKDAVFIGAYIPGEEWIEKDIVISK